MRIALLFFCLFPISLMAQDDAEALKKVRSHYYGISNNLDQLERITLNGEVIVWMKDDVPQKISKYAGEGHTTEFYFNEDKELLFIFEVKEKKEYRYYFKSSSMGQHSAPVSILFRHIDEDKTYLPPFNKKRLSEILPKITEARYVYFYVQTSLAIKEGKQIIDPREISNLERQAAIINQQALDTLNVIDKSEGSDGEDEPAYYCTDLTIQLGDKESKRVQKEIHNEGCDGGHMVMESKEVVQHFDERGKLFRKSESEIVTYFGTEAVLYGETGFESKEEIISFFQNGQMVEQFKVNYANGVMMNIQYK